MLPKILINWLNSNYQSKLVIWLNKTALKNDKKYVIKYIITLMYYLSIYHNIIKKNERIFKQKNIETLFCKYIINWFIVFLKIPLKR